MLTTDKARLLRWPGKSAPRHDAPQHPAAYHMLDVVAAAERLVDPDLPRAVRDAFLLLIALHDLGKIGAQFRAMIETGAAQRSGRHWEVTEALLIHHDALLAKRLGGDDRAREALYAAVAGHHGRPPGKKDIDSDEWDQMLRGAGEEAKADSAELIARFAAFWPAASLDGLEEEDAIALGWRLAGLTTVADWIGSNTDWFPPRAPDLPLDAYLEQARRRAEIAVEQAGLARKPARSGALYAFTLRPMQRAVMDADLSDGPTLALIEDETGAGKTEAAFLLAQRMLLAGKGAGVFFALPTMATADAMLRRAAQVAPKLIGDRPSLALAHGRAGMNDSWTALIGRDAPGEDEAQDSVSCAAWLADGRRRALLADIGVGTIDQALLAVMPTRHATTRLWGLEKKILIVDEAHEVGAGYTGRLLEALLERHASAGGSAIVMTATLPLEDRRRLVTAFERGAGRAAPTLDDMAYPALTVAPAAPREVTAPASEKGRVAVRRLADAQEAAALLSEASRKGAACVWVRNAVDDAIAAVEALRAAGVPADLLHARFALCDRRRAERRALARFHKRGLRQWRAGQVLVGTQILESSLDLDFDVMVSDLAPMASLIQRAGRLWRHMERRRAESRPVAGPVLHVVSPDPDAVEDERWLHHVLEKGGYTYPLADQWRTARALFAAGEIDAPGGLRALIEAVHGPEAEPLPQVFERGDLKQDGQNRYDRTHAEQNLIYFEDGYRRCKAADDQAFPTRLGEAQRLLVLARRSADGLAPWSGESGPRGWMLSEVQAAADKLEELDLPNQKDPEIKQATKDWPDWRREATTLCPVDPDGRICAGLRYSVERGLEFGDEET